MNLQRIEDFNISSALLLVSGFLLVLASILYNEFMLGLIDPNPPLAVETLSEI